MNWIWVLVSLGAGCDGGGAERARGSAAEEGEGARADGTANGEGEGEGEREGGAVSAEGEGEGEGEGSTGEGEGEGGEGEGEGEPPVEPDPGCQADGCLRSAQHVGDYPVAALLPFLEPGVAIDNGYSVWTIRYLTDGAESLATVTVPFPVAAPAGGYGVVANNHGTTGVGDGCALTGTVFGAGLAGLFGARGAIGVASDYPGLGTEGVHPYLVSEVEGRASLDAIRAARRLAKWRGVDVSARGAAVGLSQGGHATLAAAAEHAGGWAAELDMRAFGLTAPASVFEEHWRGGLAFAGPHITFHALLVYAWAEHYGHPSNGAPIWTDGIADRIGGIMEGSCLFEQGGTSLRRQLSDRAEELFSPGFLQAYRTGEWGEAYAVFDAGFDANRVAPFEQTAAIGIWQGDADTVVPLSATDGLVAELRAGGMEIDYTVVPGGGHGDTAFGFVAQDERATEESVSWVLERLYGDPRGGR